MPILSCFHLLIRWTFPYHDFCFIYKNYFYLILIHRGLHQTFYQSKKLTMPFLNTNFYIICQKWLFKHKFSISKLILRCYVVVNTNTASIIETMNKFCQCSSSHNTFKWKKERKKVFAVFNWGRKNETPKRFCSLIFHANEDVFTFEVDHHK